MPDIPQLTYNSTICKTARSVKKLFKLEVKLKADFRRLIRKIVLLWQGGVAISFDILETLANNAASAMMQTFTTMINSGTLTSGFALFHSLITFFTSGAQAKLALFMVVCDQLKKSLEARMQVAQEIMELSNQLKIIILKFLQITETALGTEDDLKSLIEAKNELKIATDNYGMLINKLETLNQWDEGNYAGADNALTKAEDHLAIELVEALHDAVDSISAAYGIQLANLSAGLSPGDDGYTNPTPNGESIEDFIEMQISNLEALGLQQQELIGGMLEMFNQTAPSLVRKVPMVELLEYYNVGSALFSSEINITENDNGDLTMDELELNYPEEFSLDFWNKSVRAVVTAIPKIEPDLESATQFSDEITKNYRAIRKVLLETHDEIEAEVNERNLNFIEINIQRLAWSSRVKTQHDLARTVRENTNIDDIVLMQQLDNMLETIVSACEEYPEDGKHPYEEAVALYQKSAFHFFKVFQTREKAITVINGLANANQKASEGVDSDKVLLNHINAFLAACLQDPLIAAAYTSLNNSLDTMEESDNPVQNQVAMYIRNGNIAPLMAFVTEGLSAFSSIVSGEAWDNLSNSVSNIAEELSIENIQETCFGEAVIEQETLNEQDMEITNLEIDAQIEQAEIDQLDEVDGPDAFGIDGELLQPSPNVDFLSENYTELA